tara:strand:- start:129 stop:1154 length:1026 start_codon:yes stop_codon:yes gene_type:complete
MASSLGIFCLIKAPEREVIQYVKYHLKAGAKPIFLFFDDPKDKVADMVSQFPEVVVTRCDEKFWRAARKLAPEHLADADLGNLIQRQRLVSVVAIRLALESGCDWLMQLDSDELLYPQSGVKNIFLDTPAAISVIRFPVAEAVPLFISENGAFLDTRLFKTGQRGCPPKTLMPKRKDMLREMLSYRRYWLSYWAKRQLARALGLGRLFHISYFKGHIQGKSAVRLNSGVTHMDSHYPSQSFSAELTVKTDKRVSVLHFDCQGFDSWVNKWENRVLTSSRPGNVKRISQFDAFEKLYRRDDKHGLKALFNELYGMSRYEEFVLRNLGLLVPITQPLENFSHD